MAIQFSTCSVAPDDRFDYWIDSSRKAFYPTTFHSVDNRTRFTGTLKQFLLGPLSITRVTSAATKVERTQSDLAAYDPDLIHLSPHFISIRYLQKLFQAEGVTVTDWIRERRLACCRRDLRDPAMAHLTILAVTSRWGLTNPAYFSRTFRARYGCSPREYRSTGIAGPEEPQANRLPRVP